jgi:hypothetical protein
MRNTRGRKYQPHLPPQPPRARSTKGHEPGERWLLNNAKACYDGLICKEHGRFRWKALHHSITKEDGRTFWIWQCPVDELPLRRDPFHDR